MSSILNAHLEASFRGIKAKPKVQWDAQLGLATKWLKHQLGDDRYVWHAGYEVAVFSWHFNSVPPSPLVLTPSRLLQVAEPLGQAINFMPLVFMASDQFYLKDKLIFSFLSLLVWNALGNYRLFWLVFFFNSLNYNQFTSVHITGNTLPL